MILGASFDDPAANKAFRDKYGFPYALLSDTKRELGLAYGACTSADAKYPERITVVIGADGKIERVYDKVDPFKHADQVLVDLGGTPPKEKKGLLRKLFGK